MTGPIVQVLFKGRMLKSVSFDGDRLRIGRMRENDIVINNLSVSRFHAELIRRDGAIWLEDCDSENGCFVNGERIECAEVEIGDEILIGKHQLVLRSAEEVERADPPTDPGHRGADPWDNAQTYVMGPDVAAGLLGQEPVRSDARTAILEVREQADEVPMPGEADGGPDPEHLARSLSERDAPDLVAGDDDEAQVEAKHAGLVLQTNGRLDRVLRWDQPRMLIGRSNDCDVVLPHAEVSRRHALLVREDGAYEIRDLDSINGTQVNGRRVKRHVLAVGDVIKIEHFELTFVLEPKPIGEEVATREPERPENEDDGVTMLEERLSLESPAAPAVESGPPKLREKPPASDAKSGSPRPLPPAVRTRDPNPTGSECEGADAKAERGDSGAAPEPEHDTPRKSERDAPRKQSEAPRKAEREREARRVRFEVRVDVEDLPALLRTALEAAGEQGITIPAELKLKPDRD